MSDSAIALGIFGSDKAVLATDVSAGVHTLKVTTNAASDGIVVEGFGAAKYVVGTVKAGGVHTLCARTSAANAAIALNGAGDDKIVLGTVVSGGVHTIAVTTSAANSSVLIDGFGSGLVRLGTVLAGGVHTLAVTAAPDNGFAIASFAAGESVIAAAKSGGVYSLAVSGLMDPDAAAYVARAGITTPSYIAAVSALASRLKGFGLWTKLDWLNLYCGNDTIAGAAQNVMRNDFHTTFINSPILTAGHGVTFNGSSYGILDYDPAIDAIAASKNSAGVFAWAESSIVVPPAASGNLVGCGLAVPQQSIRLTPKFGSDLMCCDINTNNTGNIFAYAAPQGYTGFWSSNRTSSNVTKGFRNGASIGTSATVSTGMGGCPMVVAYQRFDNGFLAEGFAGQISIVGWGGGFLDSDIANLYTAFSEYRTALGL